MISPDFNAISNKLGFKSFSKIALLLSTMDLSQTHSFTQDILFMKYIIVFTPITHYLYYSFEPIVWHKVSELLYYLNILCDFYTSKVKNLCCKRIKLLQFCLHFVLYHALLQL